MRDEIFHQLKREFEELFSRGYGLNELLDIIVEKLHTRVPYYNWVGFYLVDETGERLKLGPYVGEPTEHVLIPFGKGICGQAAITKSTFLVQDVSKEDNYLACSPKVKSEIVVPIIVDGKVYGELDIDSHELNAFDENDRKLLEWICERIIVFVKSVK